MIDAMTKEWVDQISADLGITSYCEERYGVNPAYLAEININVFEHMLDTVDLFGTLRA